ncbi:FAD:protein FMN transferase [Cellulomonas cellasea]|uniref:FAD:protein FMN transferase n=1 Tax=Cellulomonas cellasea TaxID=43670 RepID=A0A7W4UE94_9CELL|nr:FAD:protein FMN transferase [Cellulomonas cellasea]MBB2922219.1 thiamine biosynthesis lipoprotein [Cellulomonas cellasea]
MTTTTSRTATRAPANVGRSRLTLVAAPGPSAPWDDDRARRRQRNALAEVATGPPDATTDGLAGPAGRPGLDAHRATRDDSERREWVRRVLGVTVAVHARGPAAHTPDADGAVRSMFAELSAVERLVGTDRPGSQLSRLAGGDLALAEAHPVLRELHELCVAAHVRTDGSVDAWAGQDGPEGVFAPGGLVTTWALERAARHLADVAGAAFAVEAGGDLLLRGPQQAGGTAAPSPRGAARPATGSAGGDLGTPGDLGGLSTDDDDATRASGDVEPWRVEIEHPRDRRLVLATLPVREGGVATAVAAGDASVVDLRSGLPEPTVLAATVVGPSLVWSDVWARAAVARGTSAVEWVATLRGTRGLLVLADGTVHRWHTPG